MEVMVGAEQDYEVVNKFLSNAFIICPLTQTIAERTVLLRQKYRMKLPDAIIWATAQVNEALLITRNTRDFPIEDTTVHVPYRV
ncbi:MAG TPA: hypothetical protein PKO23_05230 [Candidatus Hydrogenedentes bacterium]|jgi:predicted nucleic acid-binding protein|nr:hypothetical protein [Candidatus Hydrogenedentota bacterium]